MLRGIHKASASWLGKAILSIIIGLLVISFAIWGIGDIFSGFGLSTVAKVGGSEVTIEQFRSYYTDRMNQLSRRLGRPISPDQARTLGLDRQIIGQFVAETALDERARTLGLGISDQDIARRITTDPTFRGLSGQFDRNRFEQMIRQAGYNEVTYVNDQRRVIVRRQIAQTVSAGIEPSIVAKSVLYRFQNEKRNADFIVLGAAQAGDVPAPEPAALAKYFEDRKVLFRAPETRKVTLLSLTAADLARWSTVSDADARTYFDRNTSEFGAPEQREIQQIVFPNAEDARKAAERIKTGVSFSDIAKQRGLKDTDTNLGMMTKAMLVDAKVADAAFALKLNEIGEPVQGRFGTVLLQVTKIVPSEQKSFENVSADIKRMIAETRARAEIGNLRDKIEDDRAAGLTLAETAKKNKLTARTLEAIDRSGRGANGAPVADLPVGVDVVGSVFSIDVGVESDPLQLPGGGYLWFDVVGITPSRDRTLDEVKDQVEARWRNDEIAARLRTKADEMVSKLRSGTALSQLATETGLKVQTAADLQRGKKPEHVPTKAIDAVFRLAQGAPGTSEGDKPSERVVFVVTSISEAKLDPTSEDAKKLNTFLTSAYGEDLVSQYIGRLEKEIGVTINDAALKKITGVATN